MGIVALGLILVGLSAIGLQRARAIRQRWPGEGDNLYLPPSGLLRAFSLGHTELAADLVAARANVYFGAQLVQKGQHRWLSRYINTAADLDPQFHRLYVGGAAVIAFAGSRLTVPSLLESNALLQRGARVFPGDWEIPFRIGFNLFFELPNVAGQDDLRVPTWRQEGLELLRQVTQYDGVPTYFPGMVARLLTKQGSQELAIKQLEQAYAATSSQETQQEILKSLARMRAEHLNLEMAAGRQRFESFVEHNYPYAPESFNVIAGPRTP